MPAEKITIAANWAEFSKMVFGNNKPSAVQYQEMRRAFYGGYVAAMTDMTQKISELSDDKGCEVISSLLEEGLHFGVEVMRGNA